MNVVVVLTIDMERKGTKSSSSSRRSFLFSLQWLPWSRRSRSSSNTDRGGVDDEHNLQKDDNAPKRRRGSSTSSWRPWIDLERFGWRRTSSEQACKAISSRCRSTSVRAAPRRNHSSHNFLSILATTAPQRSNACPRATQRKLSEAGILKPSSVGGSELTSSSRKSVSFSPEESIKIFEDLASEVSRCSHLSDEEKHSLMSAMESELRPEPKSLIPTFVFPCKRPSFVEEVADTVVMLENVNVCCADEGAMTVVGSVVVNPGLLLKHAPYNRSSSGVSKCRVGAKFSMDDWHTTETVSAYKVTKTRIPQLNHCQTFRFVIDASEMIVGDELKLGVWCVPIGLRQSLIFVDENNGHFYTLRCTAKLNQWAERAALELRNFAPAVKYNKNLG